MDPRRQAGSVRDGQCHDKLVLQTAQAAYAAGRITAIIIAIFGLELPLAPEISHEQHVQATAGQRLLHWQW